MSLESTESPEIEALKFLDIVSVAQMLGCSPRHVSRLVTTGKIPTPTKLGSLTRWSRSTLVDWIASGCPECKQEVQS